MRLLAGFLLVLVAAVPARGDDRFVLNTAADLAALCGAEASDPNYVAAIHKCHGYILGVHHLHQAVGEALEKRVYCPVDDATAQLTLDQASSQFAAWAGTQPDIAEKEALDAFLEWAASVRPCS